MKDKSINLSKRHREHLLSICEKLKSGDAADATEIAELEQFIKSMKYGLNFEQHEEEVDRMLKTHIPVFKEFKEIVNNPDSTDCNFLLEGDNLYSLKLLERTHKGRIDVVYIDPPYNTGAEDWKYNNNYIVQEDGFRHSKWLSFMEERVSIARKLLKKTGILVCAIDHYELYQLGMLLDGIFGEENRIGIVSVVHKAEGRNQEKFFATSNEFALFYAKDISQCSFQSVILDDDVLDTYDQSDEKGIYKLNNFIRLGGGDKNLRKNKPIGWYPIYVSTDMKEITLSKKDGYHEIYPITNSGTERTWKTKQKTTQMMIDSNELVAKKDSNNNITIYEKYRSGQLIKTHWVNSKYNATSGGTKVLEKIMGHKSFNYPKSLYLMEDIVKITTPKDGIILDFFAGSGTTGNAVLNVNMQDGGHRQFILCTNNEISARDTLAYLNDNGYLREYKPSSETKNTTIQNKIDVFFEKNKDVYKNLIVNNRLAYETYGICQSVTLQRLSTVITGVRLDGSKYSEGIPANLLHFQTEMIDRNDDDLDEILYEASTLLMQIENMSLSNNEAIAVADCDEDIDDIIAGYSDKLETLYIADDVLLSGKQEDFFLRHDIEIKRIPEYYYKDM